MKPRKLKFAAIMMIAVFLFSLVPLAFADEGSDDTSDTEVSAEADAKIAVTTSERAMTAEEKMRISAAMKAENEKLRMAKEQAKAEMENKRELMKDEMENKRAAMKDSIEVKREEIKQVREITKENIKIVMTERKDFMEKMKIEVKERKDTLEAARKAKKEGNLEETIARYKEYLTKAVDHLTEELEHAKENIAEKSELSDSEKSDISAAIDAQIASLASIKAEISAAAAKDELKAVAKKLADSRSEHFRRYFSLRVLSARIQGEINRAEVLEKRLDALSEKAKAKNVDISAEAALFNEKIAAASEKNREAKAKLAEVIALLKEDTDKAAIKLLMDETRQLLKDAVDSLKEAHKILKSIVSKIKESAATSVLVETTATADASAETGATA